MVSRRAPLHGGGGDGASAVRALALDHYLPEAVSRGGVPPFAIVAVDGGFWRPRLPAQLAFLGHHLAAG